ncbi:GIY-YIG nuclease family protein, partial [Candidatus Pacearchaeota archaeon]|nr:GIY-YIG nuclease family protein [Candidatus Pacearchaeota archaeon]
MESGIYLIKSKQNGKEYVGSAVNIAKRQYEHLRTLRNGNHKNILLQNHFNKHGEVLEFSTLEFCETSRLIEREQYYIDSMNPIFNIARIAGSNLGRVASKETLEKMRIARTGIKLTEEHKKKISKANTGKKRSKETKSRIAEIRTGTKRSEATKQKLKESWAARKDGPGWEKIRKKMSDSSKALNRCGANHPMYGRKHSEETKLKMLESRKLSDAGKGENNYRTPFTNIEVSIIKQQINGFIPLCEIAKKHNVYHCVIQSIKSGQSWVDIEPKITNKPKQ